MTVPIGARFDSLAPTHTRPIAGLANASAMAVAAAVGGYGLKGKLRDMGITPLFSGRRRSPKGWTGSRVCGVSRPWPHISKAILISSPGSPARNDKIPKRALFSPGLCHVPTLVGVILGRPASRNAAFAHGPAVATDLLLPIRSSPSPFHRRHARVSRPRRPLPSRPPMCRRWRC